MDWPSRIENYRKTFPRFPVAMGVAGGQIYGIWVMGNDYRSRSGYYGSYPPNYLRRVRALFPESRRVLHLFSGMVDLTEFPGDTVDLDPAVNPTFLDCAQSLENVPLENYDLVLCDPPYSVEDAEHYMPSMIKRNKVFRALARLPEGAQIVWLDQVAPMWRKDTWAAQGTIGVQRSVNHRFRCVTFYERRAHIVRDVEGL